MLNSPGIVDSYHFDCLNFSTYGYWRELDGDGKCVVNPHAPPLDVCELVGQEVDPHLLEMIGYRLIPGDRCQGGWEPPHSNYTFEALVSHCPPKPKPVSWTHDIMGYLKLFDQLDKRSKLWLLLPFNDLEFSPITLVT